MVNLKALKVKLKKLKKQKAETIPHTEERDTVNKLILDLTKQIKFIEDCGEEKADLIYKILAVKEHVNNLSKFTLEELEYHYKKIGGEI